MKIPLDLSVQDNKMVRKLKKSLYGLKQASRSWNIRLDETIKLFGFFQNPDDCVYKKTQGNAIAFLVFYVDDTLLIGNDLGMLSLTKLWLSNKFSMIDLGEASSSIEIEVTDFWDCLNPTILKRLWPSLTC